MSEYSKDELITIIEQLWYCLRNEYTYSEAQVHMNAHKMGRTTIKKSIIEEVEVDDV